MNKSKKSRNISPLVRNMLDLDVHLSRAFVKWVENFMPFRQFKNYYTALEIFCHGIVWIVLLLAFIWIVNSKHLYQVQINLLMALILDVIIIAVIKAITRRRRPSADSTSLGPDKYSFPSGHASRAMLVFYFFTYLWPVSTIFTALSLVWVFAVAMSRLLMRKHHILDVCVGILVGFLEGVLMSLLYLKAETCINLVSFLSDEKIDGAEYDI